MGRTRTISDATVLDAVLDLITAAGPAALTFARAGQAAGLAPATLVQRYGDREALIQAALLHAWDRLDAATEAADAEEPVTPEGAIRLLLRLTPLERDGVDGLLLLREDLRNPVLRARGAAWGARLAEVLGRRMDPASEGERLGRQMASVWQGAWIWWAFARNGPPEAAIREALEDWRRTARAGAPLRT